MSRISFPGRAAVVRQVQKSIGILPDGDDRRETWQEIARRLPLEPVPTIPASPSVQFPGRDELTVRVQRALGGVLVDGDDGQETWAALAQRFDPSLRAAEVSVWKSARTTEFTANYFERKVQTPNISSGRNECLGVVIHHASGYYDGTVSWCLNKASGVSYHVLINTDGHRTIIAKDEQRAWHAGKSAWKGRSGCNAFTLGLAFIGNTNDGSMRGAAGARLTADEIGSALEWLLPRMARYGWSKDDITAHRHVSPGRKDDTSQAALQQLLAALPS